MPNFTITTNDVLWALFGGLIVMAFVLFMDSQNPARYTTFDPHPSTLCQEDEAWWWVGNDTRGCVNVEEIR
jgi:hypothetical protein